MNHALLPSTQDASLPSKYTAAALAISECERIDECKEWADKSAALASYAKQSKDETLERAAMRIRARAVRRCGELLAEVEAQHTGRIRRGESPNSETRKSAAAAAGLSPDQAKTALRVANVPRESFEQQVESDRPPTVTALAAQGKKPANRVPEYERLGMTKEQFQAGMYFSAQVDRFLESARTYAAKDIIAGTERKERKALRSRLQEIHAFTGKLLRAL
jgi:hypothetical protein